MTQEVIDEGNRLLLEAYFRYSGNSRYIYLDVDNTPVELYGHQEGVKFNGVRQTPKMERLFSQTGTLVSGFSPWLNF